VCLRQAFRWFLIQVKRFPLIIIVMFNTYTSTHVCSLRGCCCCCCIVLFHIFLHNLFPFSHPFFPVGLGIGQVFVTADPKAATTFQFFGQRNDVKIKKTNLSLVPTKRRIHTGTTGLVGTIQFTKESLIPLLVNAVLKTIKTWDHGGRRDTMRRT
jgi:hypothetical protein